MERRSSEIKRFELCRLNTTVQIQTVKFLLRYIGLYASNYFNGRPLGKTSIEKLCLLWGIAQIIHVFINWYFHALVCKGSGNARFLKAPSMVTSDHIGLQILVTSHHGYRVQGQKPSIALTPCSATKS